MLKLIKLEKNYYLKGKIYKKILGIGFEKQNGTTTISILCQKSNGYSVQYWTGWTDWTDQSKVGLVTHTLENTIPTCKICYMHCH